MPHARATHPPSSSRPQVRTLLSQNTTDKTSGRAFATLKQRFPSWEAVRQAPLEDVADAIRVRARVGVPCMWLLVHLRRFHVLRGRGPVSGVLVGLQMHAWLIPARHSSPHYLRPHTLRLAMLTQPRLSMRHTAGGRPG